MPFPWRSLRLLACTALGGAALAAAPPPLLDPGRPLEGGLASGETRAYRAELPAGHLWRLAAEQRGVDVELSVQGPDGRRIAVDAPFDRQGTETLVIEPAASGSFEIAVTARERAAPAGRYEIRLDELPRGSAADRRRAAAEEALSRAGERYREGTPGRRQALAEYRRAAGEWRAAGDRRREAGALYAAAVLARLADDTREALKTGEESLALWRGLGDPLWEAATRNEIGLDHWQLGETAEARSAFEAAMALQRAAGDRYGEAVAQSNLCLMDLVRGDLRAGLDCYDRALPMLRAAGAPALEGAALISAGRAWDVLGEPQRSLAAYHQARERMRETGDREGEARCLTYLGALSQETGSSQEALAQLGEALETFRALDDRRWQGTVLHELGFVYHGLGDWSQAAAHYEQALKLHREVGDRAQEASTLINLGLVAGHLGRRREAFEDHQRALALKREVGDGWGEGLALTQLGRSALALGDAAGALDALDRAVERLHAAGSRADEAEALRSRGEVLLGLGRTAPGMADLRAALTLARAAGYPAGEGEAEYALARGERRLGHAAEARAHAAAALTRLEGLRARVGDPDLLASLSDLGHHAYDLQLELLMESHRADPAAGFDRQALESSERARARTLVELLGEAGVEAAGPDIDPALLERRQALLSRLSAKAERRARQPAGDPRRADLEAEQSALLRDLDLVEAEIRERNPAYAGLTQPRPLSTADIQALLDPDTLLLSYALGEERSYLWAVTTGAVASFELPGRKEIEPLARRLHQELSAFDVETRRRETRDAAALGRVLLGPVADRLGRRRLVVVADGALQYVPFAVLAAPAEPSEPLLVRHEIVELPSASALAVQRSVLARRPPAPRRLAVLADPIFDAGDPRVKPPSPVRHAAAAERGLKLARLPASRREAEAIAALAAPGEALVALDAAASRELVLGGGLAGFRTVHFATHGVIDAEHPALSGLVLSRVGPDGSPREGFLHLRDIYGLRLDADLVVLSGCRTALGKETHGEGMIGLTRGFLYAGARRVVASLWPVEDQATAALMRRLYTALWISGQPPAAALREAQLKIRQERRWRDPYYWAGFVLEGDWR
jgi:CHAT domain-containing protein/Tfp pilus assembly protein PilF